VPMMKILLVDDDPNIRQLVKLYLVKEGFEVTMAASGDEALKLTICTKPWGYAGKEFSRLLLERGIVDEFADPDFVVMMLTPETGTEGLNRLEQALLSIPRKTPVIEAPPASCAAHKEMSIRSALFSRSETVPARESCGRILAAATVGCPPAVPIVVCGERIDEKAVACFEYYGIESCCVVKEST